MDRFLERKRAKWLLKARSCIQSEKWDIVNFDQAVTKFKYCRFYKTSSLQKSETNASNLSPVLSEVKSAAERIKLNLSHRQLWLDDDEEDSESTEKLGNDENSGENEIPPYSKSKSSSSILNNRINTFLPASIASVMSQTFKELSQSLLNSNQDLSLMKKKIEKSMLFGLLELEKREIDHQRSEEYYIEIGGEGIVAWPEASIGAITFNTIEIVSILESIVEASFDTPGSEV